MFNIPYMITTNTITIVLDGKTYTVDSSHERFSDLKESLKLKDEDKVRELVVIVHRIEKEIEYTKGNITVEGGLVLYKNSVVDNVIVDRIMTMKEEGYDIEPMLEFLNNLMENPSRTAVRELYLFLEGSNLPITEDGHFLAYKRVKDNYFDYHSGKYDNSVGKILEMPRNEVDDVRDNTCSNGLHFCSLPYLRQFNSGCGHIMILKINPKDVVSIPSDHNNTKGRTCRYEVIGEHELDEMTPAFDSSVYEDSDDEDDGICWGCCNDEEYCCCNEPECQHEDFCLKCNGCINEDCDNDDHEYCNCDCDDHLNECSECDGCLNEDCSNEEHDVCTCSEILDDGELSLDEVTEDFSNSLNHINEEDILESIELNENINIIYDEFGDYYLNSINNNDNKSRE